MGSFDQDFRDLESKIYKTKAALLREVAELKQRVEELPPVLRYEATAKVDRLINLVR
jgi:hypothetical protein